MDSADCTIKHPDNPEFELHLTADPDDVGCMFISKGTPIDWAEREYHNWCLENGLKPIGGIISAFEAGVNAWYYNNTSESGYPIEKKDKVMREAKELPENTMADEAWWKGHDFAEELLKSS